MVAGSIIIAMPNPEDGNRISDILQHRGYRVTAVCNTAAQVLNQVHHLSCGVVICGSRFSDMYYVQLKEYLPELFEMVLLASPQVVQNSPPGIMTLTFPLKTNELVGTVDFLLQQQFRSLKKQKKAPPKRDEKERAEIDRAKAVLMERNHMTEQEAFRYIQKASMDSGTNMVETARMILLLKSNCW